MNATDQATSTRWVQLVIGIICMIMIANLQYGWTLFVNPINKAHGWSIPTSNSPSPVRRAGDLAHPDRRLDRRHSRTPARTETDGRVGGILVAMGWVINSSAESSPLLYIGAVIAGIGGGAVYATCVGNAVKWFADRRGLAVGLTAAGYGAGAALTVMPIRAVIAADGYQAAFFWFGLIQGGVVFVLGLAAARAAARRGLRTATPKVTQSTRSYTPQEVLRSPVFWVLYIMFVMVSASGLMATAQIAPIAKRLRRRQYGGVLRRHDPHRRAHRR